jgi:hypothetical protein
VGFGVDTLWLFWKAPIAHQVLAELVALQRGAQGLPEPQWPRVVLGGQELVVRPHGALGATLLLMSDAFALKLCGDPLAGMPTIQVEVRALWLWQRGADQAVADAQRIVDDLVPDSVAIHPKALEPHVTRLDLALDFQGWRPRLDQLQPLALQQLDRGEKPSGNDAGLRCRAKKWASHASVNRGFTGATYGSKSAEVSGGIYNKSVEVQDASLKDWFKTVWALSPNYKADEDVWRLEYRLRREGVTGFTFTGPDEQPTTVSTWADVRAQLPGMWHYLTGRWLVHRSQRTKKTRQVIEPWWRVFHDLETDLLHKGCSDVLRRRLVKVAEMTVAQLRGYVALFLAHSQWQGLRRDLTLEQVWPFLQAMVEDLDLECERLDKPTILQKVAQKVVTWTTTDPEHWTSPKEPTELPSFEELNKAWQERARAAFRDRPQTPEEVAARIDRLAWSHPAPKERSDDPVHKRRVFLGRNR